MSLPLNRPSPVKGESCGLFRFDVLCIHEVVFLLKFQPLLFATEFSIERSLVGSYDLIVFFGLPGLTLYTGCFHAVIHPMHC